MGPHATEETDYITRVDLTMPYETLEPQGI
jgi:hypothetical protein